MKINKLTDEEVVKFTRENDKEAYKEIISRYEDKLLRYAKYLVGDENRAADVVQEAFIKAYINLNGFKVNKKFSSWIYRIVHNEAMNTVVKNKKELSFFTGIEIDSGVDIEDEYGKKEIKKMVKNCLLQLPILYREPLSLYFLEEKSYSEISDILRIPIGTVGTRVSRAKLTMKKICKRR